ncbi:50S ribosomal protein L5 [Nanohaloarchaea archaeon H01]|nr:50S ribosomal protein L5 [Nanohaloarchaea archaeon H01]
MAENVMKQIEISKVTVNIGIGEVSDDVDKAKDLLEKITGKQAVKTQSKEGSKSFGTREGLDVGSMVTLRGEEAEKFLEKVLPAADGINESAFNEEGNFAFGVSEYIDVPGVEYDSDIGMMGFEVSVSVERPGYRVKRREYKSSEIGDEHKVSEEEAIEFVENRFDIEVSE